MIHSNIHFWFKILKIDMTNQYGFQILHFMSWGCYILFSVKWMLNDKIILLLTLLLLLLCLSYLSMRGHFCKIPHLTFPLPSSPSSCVTIRQEFGTTIYNKKKKNKRYNTWIKWLIMPIFMPTTWKNQKIYKFDWRIKTLLEAKNHNRLC